MSAKSVSIAKLATEAVVSHAHMDSHSDSDSNDLIEKGEMNPLIPVFPKHHKHMRPLSPTPVDSMQSSTHSIDHDHIAFKSHSFLFHTHMHPTEGFTTNQLCDYIDILVTRHISPINPTVHHPNHQQMQSIQNAVIRLKTLLRMHIPQPEVDKTLHTHTLNIITDESSVNKTMVPVYPIGTNAKKRTAKTVQLIKTSDRKARKWCTHSTRHLHHVFLSSQALIHHPKYCIDSSKHCGLLRGSVRQDWNTIETDNDAERNWEELAPQWFELFFDLMFVAAIVHISMEVADAYDYGRYLFMCTVFPQFGLLIVSWLQIALYNSRFRMTQMCDGLFRFAYMAFVLMMALGIEEYESKQWIWAVIYSILFIYSWSHIAVLLYLQCIRNLGVNIPINVPHIAERMGAFVLIILGETIISLLAQHVKSTQDGLFLAYAVTMAWFVIVYCIGKLYFESQPTNYEVYHRKKSHAMSTSVWRARIYKWFHMVLFFGLLGLGFGSKITVHELNHSDRYHLDQATFVFMPGISCVVICICIHVIRLTHPFEYSEKHRCLVIVVWVLRILCILVMIGILFLWQIVHHFVILIVYVICFTVQIFIDYEAKTRSIISKSANKDKSLKLYRSPKGTLHLNKKDPNSEEEEDRIECTVTTKEMSCVGHF
eukprot:50216_1